MAFSGYTANARMLAREVWEGAGLAAPLTNLKSNARYPNFPDIMSYVVSFEAPSNQGPDYSQRIYGYLTPSATGAYNFYVAANVQAELYLSPDMDPAKKVLIASVNNGTAKREWNKEANQKSATQNLEAGKSYYIEALHASYAGQGAPDHLAVTWNAAGVVPPNGSNPISSEFLSSLANPDLALVWITTQPQDATVVKTQPAGFTVAAAASFYPTINYQWQQQSPGSTTWVDLAGFTTTAYNLGAVTLADNGTKFRVLVFVPGSLVTSSVATLNVQDDTTPPVAPQPRASMARLRSACCSMNSWIRKGPPTDWAM